MSRPPLWQRVWLPASALGVFALAAFLLLQESPSAQASVPAGAPPPTPVSVATIQASEIRQWHDFSGRLEAVERVDIRSRVAGVVHAVHFREGSLVAKGALLISIDPAPYEAEVARAEAGLAAAQARLTHAGHEWQRAQRLWEDKAIAQRELDERQNAQSEAAAHLRAAQAQLQAARLNLGYTQVRAPVAGRIGRLEVTPGNLVAAGAGAPLLSTLVSVSPIYASFEADEQTVARALAGLGEQGVERIPVQMGTAAGSDTPHQGRLQLIDNQVDARSGTVRVRAVFDNADGRLMPGQFARLRMGQPQLHRQVLVNERAVATDQDKRYVLVLDEHNRTAYREVRLGASAEGLRTVLSGLQAGERIVVNGLQRVRPGDVVQPQEVPMNAPLPGASATVAAAKP